jgi:hypothetical protein
MGAKEPVLLTVFVETAGLRWFVAGIDANGGAIPLVCSESGNLTPYLGTPLDEQVSFLRHRFAGVLQRGCDRLWGRQQKPFQIVFVTDAPFAQAPPELTRRVAEHFVAWMTNPRVVFFAGRGGNSPMATAALELVAGALDSNWQSAFEAGLPKIVAAVQQPGAFELAPPKKNPGEHSSSAATQ